MINCCENLENSQGRWDLERVLVKSLGGGGILNSGRRKSSVRYNTEWTKEKEVEEDQRVSLPDLSLTQPIQPNCEKFSTSCGWWQFIEIWFTQQWTAGRKAKALGQGSLPDCGLGRCWEALKCHFLVQFQPVSCPSFLCWPQCLSSAFAQKCRQYTLSVNG